MIWKFYEKFSDGRGFWEPRTPKSAIHILYMHRRAILRAKLPQHILQEEFNKWLSAINAIRICTYLLLHLYVRTHVHMYT